MRVFQCRPNHWSCADGSLQRTTVTVELMTRGLRAMAEALEDGVVTDPLQAA